MLRTFGNREATSANHRFRRKPKERIFIHASLTGTYWTNATDERCREPFVASVPFVPETSSKPEMREYEISHRRGVSERGAVPLILGRVPALALFAERLQLGLDDVRLTLNDRAVLHLRGFV